jgi:flagellar hook-length control protein FliK
LASINNIPGLGTTTVGNAQQTKGVAAGSGGLLAFLNMLMGRVDGGLQMQGGQDIAAKLSAILKKDPTDTGSVTDLLQKLFPNASADQISQMAALLQATPPAAGGNIKASLTSDLTAQVSTDVQSTPDAFAQLKEKFDAMVQDGPVTPDKMAHFRKEAIDLLKGQGLSGDDINQYLVSLATDLGDKLTTPLAAQLGMPVPPQAVAAAQAPAAPDTAATAPADVSPAAGDPAQAGIAAPADTQTAADFNTQQLTAAAQAAAGTDAANASADIATTVADDASRTGTQTPTGIQAPTISADAKQQAPEAPAAKPVSGAAAHLFVMNAAQGDDDAGGANSNGQPFQFGASSQTASGMMHAASEASTQSFVNYMNSSNAAQPNATVQNVAVQIAQNANTGATTFTMQLEPAELGRLEVRLKFDRDGGIKAHLIADKPETLSLLRQDQAQIHRILSQAGLDADDASLSFDLRQQGQQQSLDQSYNNSGRSGGYDASTTQPDSMQARIAVEAMGYITQSGVNIMV